MNVRNLVQRAADLGIRLAAALQFLAPLVTRITLGHAFFLTGRGKLANFEDFVGFMATRGIPFPEANAAFGTTRWLPKSTSDISPIKTLNAISGTGKKAGRCNARASSRVNSRFVTGSGATPLTGPAKLEVTIAWRKIPTMSLM